jgi:hypothetical protein
MIIGNRNRLCVTILVAIKIRFCGQLYISELLCFSIPLTTEWSLHYHHCREVKHRSGITETPVAIQFRSLFNMRVIGSKKKEYAGRKLVG